MAATRNPGLTKGYDTLTALTKNRFIKGTTMGFVGPITVAGEQAHGVTQFSVSDSEIIRGKGASVTHDGIEVLEAGDGTPVAWGPVTTDSVGRAVAATSGDCILGWFREVPDNVAAGNAVSVILNFSGATAA